MPGQFTPSEATTIALVAFMVISALAVLCLIAFSRGERE